MRGQRVLPLLEDGEGLSTRIGGRPWAWRSSHCGRSDHSLPLGSYLLGLPMSFKLTQLDAFRLCRVWESFFGQRVTPCQVGCYTRLEISAEKVTFRIEFHKTHKLVFESSAAIFTTDILYMSVTLNYVK